MSQIHQSRTSDHPYIDRVWYSQNLTDGVYLATPDGSWDLIVGADQKGKKSMMLTGQATEPAYIPYQANTSAVVISFAPGVFLPSMTAQLLVDRAIMLPTVDDDHFQLADHTFAFPAFDNAEELVEQMITAGILQHDALVTSHTTAQPKAASKRAVQRHFVQTTGLTPHQLKQIQRAQEAVRLLKDGKKPSDAAADAGYTDQPHLSKSLKKIMHRKPSDVDDIHKL